LGLQAAGKVLSRPVLPAKQTVPLRSWLVGMGAGQPKRFKVAGESPGGARQPVWSDVSALRQGKRVFKIHAQVADCAFDLPVAEQDLNRPQVPGALVDQ
jgi:hypothetical protein